MPVFHTQRPEVAVLYYPHLTLDLTRRQTKSKLNMHCSGTKKIKREVILPAAPRTLMQNSSQFVLARGHLSGERSTMNAQPILPRNEIQVLTLTLLEVKGMKDARPDTPRSFTT